MIVRPKVEKDLPSRAAETADACGEPPDMPVPIQGAATPASRLPLHERWPGHPAAWQAGGAAVVLALIGAT